MWVKNLFPQTVARYSTVYNQDIRVIKEAGKYKLLVNGSRQSGEYIRKLWQQAFVAFGIIPSPDVKKILVLGVAGGTVIHLLHSIYPDATIGAVDIDPVMVEIGKKYFGLDMAHVVVSDAQAFVQKTTGKWNMIIVDLFIGASIPPLVSDERFLRAIKKALSPKGIIIFNYLREFEYGTLSQIFFKTLKKIFSEVKDTKIYFNRFFMVK